MLEYENIRLHWLGHDSFLIEAKGKNIYIDPFKINKSSIPVADIIITTHEHFDHCNPDQISQISSKDKFADVGYSKGEIDRLRSAVLMILLLSLSENL